MKKLLPFTFILISFCFISCDKIKDPIVKKTTVVGSKFITKNNFAVSDFKKTLLEDYTGMKCVFCPAAALVAKNLSTAYGSSLVVVAVHAGGFAKPFGLFTADYRTDAGDVWFGSQGFAIPSNPNGMVNRTKYAADVVVYHTNWSSSVSQAKNDPMIVKLNVITNYDSTVGALNTDVTAIFKKAYPDPIKISVILTEDGIVGRQTDGAIEIEDYEFEHMLRGAVNSTWGSDLTTTAKAVNDSVKVSFNDFDLRKMTYTIIKQPPAVNEIKPIVVNDKNISVVVIAYKATTREVLQVEKVKIR